MDKQEIELKKSKRKLIVRVVISGLIAVVCIINEFMIWANKEGLWLVILGGLVALVACVYYIRELANRKIEMMISAEGIRLLGKGFYSWSSIESFSTDVDEDNVALVLHINGKADVQFDVTILEIKKEELIDLVLTYGQHAGLYYRKPKWSLLGNKFTKYNT
jgi:hypothetical protein